MTDLLAVASAAAKLRESRTPYIVATVVRIEGSSYRRPGARLVFTAEGRVAGTVSGGCIEQDLIRTGFWRTRNGPALVRYDSSELDEDQPVLGCGGIVDVLLEQGDADPLAAVHTAIAYGRTAAVATVFASDDPLLPVGMHWALTGAASPISEVAKRVVERQRPEQIELSAAQVLVEPIVPPPHLFIFGSGVDVKPIVLIAKQLGWLVTVWCRPRAHPDPSAAHSGRICCTEQARRHEHTDRCSRALGGAGHGTQPYSRP